MPSGWPAVAYEGWRATCDTLHGHTQVLGKLAVALGAPEPQLQHAALRLTARGWETPLLPAPLEGPIYVVQVPGRPLPDLAVQLRGAVSIARRLQDPLAELVKIDPKSIGVGQYQHDVSQSQLAKKLDAVVEDCVNAVGVDANTASAPLLARVSGIGSGLAQSIVQHRDENGPFKSRKALKEVPRLGPKAFEQCAGFLRIQGGEDPRAQAGASGGIVVVEEYGELVATEPSNGVARAHAVPQPCGELHEQLVRAGVHVGALVINKRSPADAGDFLAERRALEEVHVATLRGALPGVPLLQVPLLPGDVVGQEALERFGDALAQGDLRAT